MQVHRVEAKVSDGRNVIENIAEYKPGTDVSGLLHKWGCVIISMLNRRFCLYDMEEISLYNENSKEQE